MGSSGLGFLLFLVLAFAVGISFIVSFLARSHRDGLVASVRENYLDDGFSEFVNENDKAF